MSQRSDIIDIITMAMAANVMKREPLLLIDRATGGYLLLLSSYLFALTAPQVATY